MANHSTHSSTLGNPAPQGFYPGEVAEGQKMSAVGFAEYAMEQARELSMRLMSLADRITGPVPPSPTSAGKNIAVDPMGVFPILMSSSERTQSIISEGFDALNRIERSLP